MDEKDLTHFKTPLENHAKEIRLLLAGSESVDDSIEVDNAIGRLTRMEDIQTQATSAEVAIARKRGRRTSNTCCSASPTALASAAGTPFRASG